VRLPPHRLAPPVRVVKAPQTSAAAPYRQRVLHGTVRGSLYRTLLTQGGTAQMADDLADIFSLEVDFRTAIRSGDKVRLLIEERPSGKKLLYRRILAAEVRARQRVLQAVYYPEDDAYYRPDGRSLERMFLSAPVRAARISSAFSHRRLHPVLKSYRPHLGIDYAAPAGTPVRSVGDGVVTWAGLKGGNGKMVEIRHNKTYSTYYLHLSRIANTIRVGTAVEQGQVIGYVGATGLATGPHLDFRLAKNGSFLNPLENQDIAAPAISHKELPTFRAYARRLLATLDRPGVVAPSL
jgi:murein DD-endopeptidase MepM/ murein hydrolase activator NlpD